MAREIKTVLSTIEYNDWHWEKIEQALQPAKIIRARKEDTEAISEALKEADVALLHADLNDQILKEGKKLKWIHCNIGGINGSARPEVFERGILLTGSAGRSGPVLAEHTFFLALSLIYRLREIARNQEEHRWQWGIYENDRGLYQKTIGIIGMGYTGQETALRAKAFGMRVLGYGRCEGTGRGLEYVDEMYYADREGDLEKLLAQSDIVVLCIRLSDATYHMIDAKAFEIMKDTALLINMARGAVVDEPAMAEALRTGKIAGAACDTFEQEPLPEDSPLWDLPNMVITPHGTPEMPDMPGECVKIICENIEHYRKEEPMKNQLYPRDAYTAVRKKQ